MDIKNSIVSLFQMRKWFAPKRRSSHLWTWTLYLDENRLQIVDILSFDMQSNEKKKKKTLRSIIG